MYNYPSSKLQFSGLPCSLATDTAIKCQIKKSFYEDSVAEPLAPIIGVRLRYRNKWEIYSEYELIFAFLVNYKGYNPRKKIGTTVNMVVIPEYYAYLGLDITQNYYPISRSGPDFAPIF